MGSDKMLRKTPFFVKMLALGFGCLCVCIAIMVSPLGPWLKARDIEKQVKENVNPQELQQWATNLLAHQNKHQRQHPFDYYHDSEGTNMPGGLKRVWGYGHDVEIFKEKEGSHVVIFGGRKSGPLLIVGPPSMDTPSNPNTIPWKPGMYFLKE